MMHTAKSCHLHHRGVLRLAGQDRRSFLQGIISNDINLCRPDHLLYATLLTPQGKYLHDIFIMDGGDCFLIDCEADRRDDLLKRLRFYTLRAKITLDDVNTDYTVWAFWGGLTPDYDTIPMDPRLAALGKRVIAPPNYKSAGWPSDFADYDRHRLSLGIPDGSRDMIIEKSTLLEGSLDRLNAISWSKGCYMGQELTARMHYRALLKKRLYPVNLQGTAPNSADITLNDAVIGTMASSCGNLGLALLNIEQAEIAVQNKASFGCDGALLQPFKPEWME